MQILLAPLAFLAATAAAQATACGANYIVEACLSTEQSRLGACGTTDYQCQCGVWGDIMTCFNNCPDDSRKFSYQGQQQIFCEYATQFPNAGATSQPTTAAAQASAGQPQTTEKAAATNVAATGSSSRTGTGSAAAATSSNSAAELALGAGRVLVVVAVAVAATL